MSDAPPDSEDPSPEGKSNNAMLCFCIGLGCAALAYFLGFGAAFGALMLGDDPGAAVGGVFAFIGIVLLGVSGFVLMVVGGVWMIVRVVADQSAGDRYSKNVDR